MARNHQEWARHRKEYGEWDYVTNQKVIDNFFREGIRRCKDTEDIITIGMRGDGDTGIGGKEGHDDETAANNDEEIIKLLERIVKNQRQIIAEETGRPAKERPDATRSKSISTASSTKPPRMYIVSCIRLSVGE